MKIRLLVNIDFEYGGIKKTRFKAGQIFEALSAFKFVDGKQTDIIDGFWIGSERTNRITSVLKTVGEAPGYLIQTKCFMNECEIMKL